jgi:hypothetical protein
MFSFIYSFLLLSLVRETDKKKKKNKQRNKESNIRATNKMNLGDTGESDCLVKENFTKK